MWREYTRETPARRGWAVVAAAMALAGTTGLAYYVTITQAAPGGASERRVVPPGWPISFVLPSGFAPGKSDMGEVTVTRDGMSGTVHCERAKGPSGPTSLAVQFKVRDEGVVLSRAFTQVTGQDADLAEPIKIGPLDGLAAAAVDSRGVVKFVAVATHPGGLVVQIELRVPSVSARQRRQFEVLCESVQFKDWFVEIGAADGWMQ